jgi:hypothetical protein
VPVRCWPNWPGANEYQHIFFQFACGVQFYAANREVDEGQPMGWPEIC